MPMLSWLPHSCPTKDPSPTGLVCTFMRSSTSLHALGPWLQWFTWRDECLKSVALTIRWEWHRRFLWPPHVSHPFDQPKFFLTFQVHPLLPIRTTILFIYLFLICFSVILTAMFPPAAVKLSNFIFFISFPLCIDFLFMFLKAPTPFSLSFDLNYLHSSLYGKASPRHSFPCSIMQWDPFSSYPQDPSHPWPTSPLPDNLLVPLFL